MYNIEKWKLYNVNDSNGYEHINDIIDNLIQWYDDISVGCFISETYIRLTFIIYDGDNSIGYTANNYKVKKSNTRGYRTKQIDEYLNNKIDKRKRLYRIDKLLDI